MVRKRTKLNTKILQIDSLYFYLFLLSSTILRIIYSIQFMDPMSGPDASTYYSVFRTYSEKGWFAEHEAVPFWQPGYPWFLTLLNVLTFFSGLESMMVAQTCILSIGTLVVYKIMRIFASKNAELIGIFLCLNPALFAASTQLMYETTQISLVMISLMCMLKLMQSTNRNQLFRFLFWLGLYISAFFAITIQPKILLIYVILIVFSKPTAWSLAKTIPFAFPILLPLFLLQIRNLVTGFGWGISSNFRTHMLIGNQQVINQNSTCSLSSKDSVGELFCLLKERFMDPVKGIEIMLHNSFDFFAPYIGPLGMGGFNGTGTWFHGFDFRRLLPAELRNESTFKLLDSTTSRLWMLALVGSIVLGFSISQKNSESKRFGLAFFASTIATFMPTIFGVGDARYRIGAMFFYTPLCIISLSYTFTHIINAVPKLRSRHVQKLN